MVVELIGRGVEVHRLEPGVEKDLELKVGYAGVVVDLLGDDGCEMTTSAVTGHDDAMGVDAELAGVLQEIFGCYDAIIGTSWERVLGSKPIPI